MAFGGRPPAQAEANSVFICDRKGQFESQLELRFRQTVLEQIPGTFEFARVERPHARSVWSIAWSADDVRQVRVMLGLPPIPPNGELTSVPPDLNQNFSTVRQPLGDLVQTLAQIGLPLPGIDRSPRQVLDWIQ